MKECRIMELGELPVNCGWEMENLFEEVLSGIL